MSLTFSNPNIRKTTTCYKCGKRIKEVKLCDYGTSILNLCNKDMCQECANEIGDDTHICDEHNYDLAIAIAKKNRAILKKILD